jgi:hypothetical protein
LVSASFSSKVLTVKTSALFSLLFVACISTAAICQDSTETISTIPNQQVTVDVPTYIATTADPLDLLQTTVATVLRDPTICCGKGSALYARLSPMDAGSLPRVAERLRGKHAMSDGSAIVMEDRYWPRESVHAEDIIKSLMEKRAFLMDWDGHIYALYGAVFDLNKRSSGYEERVVRSFLLLDTRYSDGRRFLKFDRQKDSWQKVRGFLEFKVTTTK